MLQAYVVNKPSKWEQYLPILEFSYDSSKHTSVGYSPFIFLYDFHLRTAINVTIYCDSTSSIRNFLRDMNQMLNIAKQNVKIAQNRARFYAYHDRCHRVLNIGQQVFL